MSFSHIHFGCVRLFCGNSKIQQVDDEFRNLLIIDQIAAQQTGKVAKGYRARTSRDLFYSFLLIDKEIISF